MMKEKKKFLPLTSQAVCEIYNLLHKDGFIAFSSTDESQNKIDALVANITGASFGVDHYSTAEEKVVAYLYFIIKNHAFTDGNKRTAVLVFLVLCRINNLENNLENISLDALAVFLEQQTQDHQLVIQVVARSIFTK